MKRITSLIKDDRGAITAMTVIMLAVFVGFLAMVIDLGHLHTVQNELRNAAMPAPCAAPGRSCRMTSAVTGHRPCAGPDDMRPRRRPVLPSGDNKSDDAEPDRPSHRRNPGGHLEL